MPGGPASAEPACLEVRELRREALADARVCEALEEGLAVLVAQDVELVQRVPLGQRVGTAG